MAQRKRKRRKGGASGGGATSRRHHDGTKVGLAVFAVVIVGVFVVALYALIAGHDPLSTP